MFLETSALTGENVEEAFVQCARKILNKIESGMSCSQHPYLCEPQRLFCQTTGFCISLNTTTSVRNKIFLYHSEAQTANPLTSWPTALFQEVSNFNKRLLQRDKLGVLI